MKLQGTAKYIRNGEIFMDRQWKAKWISSKDYVDLKIREIYYRELPKDFNPDAPVWNHIPHHDISLQNDHILIRKVFDIDCELL